MFNNVQKLASEINMKVNSKKTQMLCVHASQNSRARSYINTADGGVITSADSLKILGFHFNSEPNANYHVEKIIDKFYSKLWTLRFLKRSGMDATNLLGIYCSIIRPSIEYSNVVYHSLIPEYLSNKLETVQRQAIKIIYGPSVNYDSIVERGLIETLKSRRETAVLKFANKVVNSPRFGQEWFTLTNIPREARQSTRNRYIEKQVRTERGRNNPLHLMTRLLNEQHRAN